MSNKTRDGREKNRRVEFKIIDDGHEDVPVVEELEAIPDSEETLQEDADDAAPVETESDAEAETPPKAEVNTEDSAEEDAEGRREGPVEDDMPEGDE